MSDRKKNISRYIISDYIFSVITWLIFIRLVYDLWPDAHLLARILLLSLGWTTWYAFAGSYHSSLYEKSRLNELTSTLIFTFTGSLLLAAFSFPFGITGFGSFAFYFVLQFLAVFAGRSLLLYQVKKAFTRGELYFNTLIVGNNTHAVKLYRELNKNFKYLGFKPVGFVTVETESRNGLVNGCRILAVPQIWRRLSTGKK
jgi:FlaA1/EpsC-like NDP-sugar epimerase